MEFSLLNEERLISEGFPVTCYEPMLLRIGKVEAVSCLTVGQVFKNDSNVTGGCYR
jgi:hypothetical protein